MLPDSERLRRSSLFQRTYAGKKSISSPLLTLYVLPRQPRSAPRLPLVGFVVGKKVHNRAVKRNRAKRRVREAYRLMRLSESGLQQWYTLVFLIHNAALEADWNQIKGSVSEVLNKAEKRYGKQPSSGEPAR